MNILIVATWYPTSASPINGIFVAQQASALARTHAVTVLAPEYRAGLAKAEFSEENAGAAKVVRAFVPPGRLALARGYASAIATIIRRINPDLVHAHVTLPGGAAAAIAAWRTGKPLVITEHRSPFSACMQTLRDRAIVKLAMRSAKSVIAVSNSLRSDIAHYGITRHIDVVPNMYDSRLFRSTPRQPRPESGYRILFAGRLSDEQKNLPSLLRALAILSTTGNFRLGIVGDGCLLPKYREFAASIGVADRCEFLGQLSANEFKEQLVQSDVLALPSLHETFGIVITEALAVGRPVVATDCGGPRDILTPELGRLIPIDDDAALADAISDVCGRLDSFDPQKLSSVAEDRFGEEAIVRQLEKIYRRVLA